MSRVKEFLKTSKYTKGIVYFGIELNNNLHQKKRDLITRVRIKKSGIKLIDTIQKILKKNGVFFFFDMGTLLGIVREGCIIKHDLDIDIAVRVDSEAEKENIKNILSSIGAVECCRYKVDELGVVEQSYIYKDVKFDINYYVTKGDKDYCYLMYRDPDKEYSIDEMSVVELSCSHIENIALHKFSRISVNVPENAEAYLSDRYGENWRIPDKKYVYWRGPSTSLTDYVGKRIGSL